MQENMFGLNIYKYLNYFASELVVCASASLGKHIHVWVAFLMPLVPSVSRCCKTVSIWGASPAMRARCSGRFPGKGLGWRLDSHVFSQG